MTEEKKKLYRSRTDRMIGGVCGGLGEYFGVDSTAVRVLFIIAALLGGHGLLIYLACVILIPLEPPAAFEATSTQVDKPPVEPSPTITPEEPKA